MGQRIESQWNSLSRDNLIQQIFTTYPFAILNIERNSNAGNVGLFNTADISGHTGYLTELRVNLK